MAFFSMKSAYEKLIRWTGNSQWWIVCSAVMFEPVFDAAVGYVFEKRNEGKLWKDVERNLRLKEAALEK